MSFQLETNRLLLQIEREDKAADVLSFYKENASLFDCYEPTRPANFYTLSYQKAMLQYEYDQMIKGKTLRYYVYCKEEPFRIIGSVNFSRIEHGPFSHASIGYKFHQYFHKKGYAFEACQAAIPVIFQNYNIHRLEARVATDNLPSIKLLEKLSFQFEGIEYQSVEVQGTFKDHYRYSLLCPDIF